ncbi:hypothetical protein ACGGAI_23880 [Streptomyces antibioticus]|uniref:hypothetical protein n=1 Tax=Streptomyces antibioticus TaxID=1890 RepID=UPI0037128453
MQYVTIGGVTVGVCVAAYYLVGWWPGANALRKDPLRSLATLLPFLAAWCYGALAVLGVGGLVGWVADTALWISNWLGDVALVWGVGGQAGAHASTSNYLPLTQAGTGVVLILTAVMAALLKKSGRARDLKMGMWCGVCLAMSAGVAGFAAVPLAQSANAVGGWVYGGL